MEKITVGTLVTISDPDFLRLYEGRMQVYAQRLFIPGTCGMVTNIISNYGIEVAEVSWIPFGMYPDHPGLTVPLQYLSVHEPEQRSPLR